MNIEMTAIRHGSTYMPCVVFFVLSMFTSSSAAQMYDFAYHASLNGQGHGVPVRAAIPQDIIVWTSPGFEDLRVYNDLGEEVDRAVFPQYRIKPVFVSWEVIDSHVHDGTVSVVLKRKQFEGYVSDIEIIPEKGMFHNEVEIFSSNDTASWRYLASASIVDLRPRLDVYHTNVYIPETGDSYLRVDVRQFRAKPRDPYLDVFLEQSGFDRFSAGMGIIKVKGALSGISRQDMQRPVYDQILFTSPETCLDDEGNTIIDLGKTGLPIDKVSLKVTDPYFFREVQLWAISEKGSGSYVLEGGGNIYCMDAYGISRTSVPFEKDRCRYVRIKILNKGRPPLSISNVALRWIRRELYFIPEPHRQYAVYFRSRNAGNMQHRLEDIMSRDPEKWTTYASWKTGRIEKNESYDPDSHIKKWFKTVFSMGFIILMIYMLGFFIIQIKNRIPKTGPW
ncbi:MAG TPA: hypothetical protein ENN05_04370 [Deltaproteobacteria bacterium]|nr:hypothetical protein [Deltaproteobacteria bacterium]